MKLKKNTKLTLLAFVALATFSTQIIANEPSKETVVKTTVEDKTQESFDFADITCWDIMTLSDQDRPAALTLLYGFHAGKNGISTHTGGDIEKTLTQTGEICAENPDKKALATLEDILK
jgi:hypothetical protein